LHTITHESAVAIVLLIVCAACQLCFKLTTDGVKTLSEAFKTYQEGMQIKEGGDEKRQADAARTLEEVERLVKNAIDDEPHLQLSSKEKTELTKLIHRVFVDEGSHLAPPYDLHEPK
jgi:hypothetical protein